MTFVQFFRSLDPLIQGWCALLVALFVVSLVWMVSEWVSVRRTILRARDLFHPHRQKSADERRYGRALDTIDEVRQAAAKPGSESLSWWPHVHDAVEKYESPDGKEGYFITSPIEDLVTLDDVTRGYAWSVYHAVPGILTSLGLLGTFVAILLGLQGLQMNSTSGTVVGLDNLISNLSGKFLTSIIALALSVVFLFVELVFAQPSLRRARLSLVGVLQDVFPFLSASRVMLDLQRESVKQSRAMANISSDVVEKFANIFVGDLAPALASTLSGSMASQLQTEMGPTLSELTRTMRELESTVKGLEQSKQESVVGELRGLLGSLESSLRATLQQMAEQFQAALTGSTQDQFGALAETIKGSASVVHDMNTNFTLLQSTLQAVVEEARTTTSAQMHAGAEQTQRLNALVEGLMVRLNDTASQNYQQLTATLTSVVTDLSDRVTKLSEELTQTVSAATSQSQQAASETMKKAGDWSAYTSHQLAELVAALQRKSEDFDRAGQTLLAAQATLKATLDQNNQALGSLGRAAAEVKAYTEGLAGIRVQVAEGQAEQTRLATISRESVLKLTDAAARQEQFLDKYKASVEQYQQAFSQVDAHMGAILGTMLDRLQQYNTSVEQNFRSIVESANSVMPRMANVLKASTDELKEHLDELNEVLDKGTTRIAEARVAR
jgi:hypothetical protein